jgi:hypothetical protein
MGGSPEADEGRDEADDDEQIAFGQSPPEEFDLPPEDEVDEDDVARISLRGEGDWMHPDDDFERVDGLSIEVPLTDDERERLHGYLAPEP